MSKQLNIFNDAANTWKKEAAEASARDYNFDTLSGERLGQLYYPALINKDVTVTNMINNMGINKGKMGFFFCQK